MVFTAPHDIATTTATDPPRWSVPRCLPRCSPKLKFSSSLSAADNSAVSICGLYVWSLGEVWSQLRAVFGVCVRYRLLCAVSV